MPRGESTLSLTKGSDAPERTGLAPHLFFVLCSDRPLDPPAASSLAGVDEVVLGRGEGDAITATATGEGAVRRLELRLPDRRMSSAHARISRVLDGWMLEDTRSKNGVLVNGAKKARVELADGDVLELGHSFFIFRTALPVPASPPAPASTPALATLLPAYAAALERLAAVAPSALPILLRGESGSGKEAIARAVHALSGRGGAFVALGSGALTDTMLDVELFGVEAGAFPGATETRPGVVRAADGGTLFVDELCDLSSVAQAALLRALEAQEIHPLGAARPVRVDLRCIATTNRDLDAAVASGSLRRDLVARLDGLTVHIPPLRERREDLGLLVAEIIRRAAGDRAERIRLDTAVVRALLAHDWPGNVRELDQCLRTALVVAKADELELEHLPRLEAEPAPREDDVRVLAKIEAASDDLALRLEGEFWSIQYQGTVLRLADTHGLHYIAHLVANAGREFHVLDLSAVVRGEAPEPRERGAGAGPALDAEAKRAYRDQITALKAELEEATRWNDTPRAERAQAELDFLTEELARGVGLGGRDRTNASASERARANITARIRKVIKRIEEQSPALAHHLSACIKTGTFCSYSPVPRKKR